MSIEFIREGDPNSQGGVCTHEGLGFMPAEQPRFIYNFQLEENKD